MSTFRDRLKEVQDKIAAAAVKSHRDPKHVQIVAVVKGRTTEEILEAWRGGLTHFGENYLQDAIEKIKVLPSEAIWHFIGHVQQNKIKGIIDSFSWVQSVDSLAVAYELDKREAFTKKQLSILLQINIGEEATKKGIKPHDLESTVLKMADLQHVRLRGLMCLPPPQEDPEKSRHYFRRMHHLIERLRKLHPALPLTELSMGTSQDFEVAVEEGATLVRIGTALLGPRREEKPTAL